MESRPKYLYKTNHEKIYMGESSEWFSGFRDLGYDKDGYPHLKIIMPGCNEKLMILILGFIEVIMIFNCGGFYFLFNKKISIVPTNFFYQPFVSLLSIYGFAHQVKIFFYWTFVVLLPTTICQIKFDIVDRLCQMKILTNLTLSNKVWSSRQASTP